MAELNKPQFAGEGTMTKEATAPLSPVRIVEREKLLRLVQSREITTGHYFILSWLIDVLWQPGRPHIPMTQSQVAAALEHDTPTVRAAIRALRYCGVLRTHVDTSKGRGKIVINPAYVKPCDPEVAQLQAFHWNDAI